MRFICLALLFAASAFAHIGSPDVYTEGSAGPYPVLITVQPPAVIPGVAQIGLRTTATDVQGVEITPIPMVGEASKHPPTPDVMQRSKEDPRYFTGALWIMATGSWKVRVVANGSRGRGEFSVPVPAVASSIKPMDVPLAAGLVVLTLVLIGGIVSIAGAGVREAKLQPGEPAPASNVKRARFVMALTLAGVVAIVWLGNSWWTAEAGTYARHLYKPLAMTARLEGSKALLQLSDPGWLESRKVDDFVPDHGHLMHLYVLRWPQLDRVWHLHPENTAPAEFVHNLPDMPAGDYRLFADVVHANGFPETLQADVKLPADLHGSELRGDDAGGVVPDNHDANVAVLPDGWRMVWERPSGDLTVKKPVAFTFHLESPAGEMVRDLDLYMGMPGHAAFVKDDGTVFAHIHPNGTAAMPALMMANPTTDVMASDARAQVSFPYGFPSPGAYHIIVQLKHNGRVETGVFKAATNPSTAP